MQIYKRVIKYPDYALEQFYQTQKSALNCIDAVEQITPHMWIGIDNISGHNAVITTVLVHK